MQLDIFRSLRGHRGDRRSIFRDVREAALAGIEARLPLTADERGALLRDLKLFCLTSQRWRWIQSLCGDVLNVIGELAKEGMTMITVTHEMDFAMSIFDRIVFMENGVIELDAAPDAIRHQDGAERVRRFIGVAREGEGTQVDRGISVALGS